MCERLQANINNVKSTLIIIMLLIAALIMQCTSSQKTVYDIPDHVPKEIEVLLVQRAEKGKTLYKIHCTGCHGIFTKGKDGIPNFTKTQIDNYHAAALIGIDPKNHAVAKKMSAEQLDYIFAFLRLRKIEK